MIYEFIVILKHDFVQKDAEKMLSTHLEKEGFHVLEKQWWGKKDLAYPIKKNKQGQYIFMKIEAQKINPRVFLNKLKMEPNVLRSLLVKVINKK